MRARIPARINNTPMPQHHKVKPAREEKGVEWYRTKTYTIQHTDVGGDVQPEPEVAQNEHQLENQHNR